jgi:hypothetical protein
VIPADHGLIRIVLVASQQRLDLPILSPAILDRQDVVRLPSAATKA